MMITSGGNHKQVITHRGSGLQEASDPNLMAQGMQKLIVQSRSNVFLPKIHPTQAVRPDDPF